MAWASSSAISTDERNFVLMSDGGRRLNGDCSAGWAILLSCNGQFTLLACGAKFFKGVSSFDAEIMALELAVEVFHKVLTLGRIILPYAVDGYLGDSDIDALTELNP